MTPRDKQGFTGSGAEEPPMGTAGGSGNPAADALKDAAKAEDQLGQATQKRQRFNLNDPAVQAAKAAAAATQDLIAAEEKLTRTIEARRQAQAGLSTGPGVSRKNDLLDEAFGVPRAAPHRPQGEGPAGGTDSKMEAALRAERELAGLMRERLGLAKQLAGVSTAPAPGAGAKGYSGPAMVGGERPGVSAREAGLARQDAKFAGGATVRQQFGVSDARLASGGGPQIHDAATGQKRFAHREGGQEQPQDKPREDAKKPSNLERFAAGVGFTHRAVMSAVQFIDHDTKAATQPFLNDRQRMVNRIPMGQTLQDLSDRIFFGADAMREVKTEAAKIVIRAPIKAQHEEQLFDLRQEQDEREARRNAYLGNDVDVKSGVMRKVPPIGQPAPIGYYDSQAKAYSTERESITGRRRYALAERERPYRDRLSEANLEHTVTMRRMQTLDRQDQLRQNRIAAIKFDLEGADGKGGLKAPARQEENDREKTLAKIKVLEDERDRLISQGASISATRSGLRDHLATISERREQASLGVRQVQLEDLQRREETARGQATNLGMLGVDGRMQAILAKQIVDQVGIENAPQALIGQASAAFPETIQRMAEQAGQQFVPQFRQQGKEEYRDDVSDVSQQRDQQMRQSRQELIDATGEKLDRLVDSVIRFTEEIRSGLGDRLESAIRRIDAESQLRNQQGK